MTTSKRQLRPCSVLAVVPPSRPTPESAETVERTSSSATSAGMFQHIIYIYIYIYTYIYIYIYVSISFIFKIAYFG